MAGYKAYANRAYCTFSPWNLNSHMYTIQMINLGNNFISSLEIVSALNSLNLAFDQYHFNYGNCFQKYNPKVYLGTIQSAAYTWNYDKQNAEKWTQQGNEKSGSWPQNLN